MVTKPIWARGGLRIARAALSRVEQAGRDAPVRIVDFDEPIDQSNRAVVGFHYIYVSENDRATYVVVRSQK